MKIKGSEKISKYLDQARELNKLWNMSDSDNNCNSCTCNGLQRFGKETGRIRKQRKKRDYPDYSIVEIS